MRDRYLFGTALALILVTGIVLAFLPLSARANGVFVVNTTLDGNDIQPGNGVCETGTGNGICTVRAAVQEANARGGDDTITLPAGDYVLTLAGINEDYAATGDLDFQSNITLNGAGSDITVIDGNANDRVIQIFQGKTVTLSGVTLKNGNALGQNGGGLLNDGVLNLTAGAIITNTAARGGGIYNSGTLIVSDTVVSDNAATLAAGGIENDNQSEEMVLTNVRVNRNLAPAGGGIVNEDVLTLKHVTLDQNRAQGAYGAGYAGLVNQIDSIVAGDYVTITQNSTVGDGGGIGNGGALTLAHFYVANNSAGTGQASKGGGIFSSGVVTLTDGTLMANTALDGGAIYSGDINNLGLVVSVTLTNVSVMSNTASFNSGGGIDNQTGVLTMIDSALIGNSAPQSTGGGIRNHGTLHITGSELSNNRTDNQYTGTSGGAIFNQGGTVTLDATNVISNAARYYGGGLFNSGGVMSVTNSIISLNRALVNGGGVGNDMGSTFMMSGGEITGNYAWGNGGGFINGVNSGNTDKATLDYVLIADNSAAVTDGGGIENTRELTISNSIIRNNHADSSRGGGVYNSGTGLRLERDVFTGNTAQRGAALANVFNSTWITNTTISGNVAQGTDAAVLNDLQGALFLDNVTLVNNVGGGLYGLTDNPANGHRTHLKNTLIANNTVGNNCNGNIVSDGYNLDSGTSCGLSGTGDLVNTAPSLGGLQDNGGDTLTHALLNGSAAIDAGDDANCPATDQRGYVRPQDGNGDGTARCDIGAYEAGASPTATPTLTATLTGTPTATATITATSTQTAVPTATGTPTMTPTATPTLTATPTSTVAPTSNETPTLLVVNSVTPTGTRTRTPTDTITSTSTPTGTVTPTATAMPTGTPSPTPTMTADACAGAPGVAQLVAPANKTKIIKTNVVVSWKSVACATKYQILVRKGSKQGATFASKRVAGLSLDVKKLYKGQTYFWRVQACSDTTCGGWTGWRSFRVNQ